MPLQRPFHRAGAGLAVAAQLVDVGCEQRPKRGALPGSRSDGFDVGDSLQTLRFSPLGLNSGPQIALSSLVLRRQLLAPRSSLRKRQSGPDRQAHAIAGRRGVAEIESNGTVHQLAHLEHAFATRRRVGFPFAALHRSD